MQKWVTYAEMSRILRNRLHTRRGSVKYFFQNLFTFFWSNTSFKCFSYSSDQILLSKPFHILLVKYFFRNIFHIPLVKYLFRNLFVFFWSNTSFKCFLDFMVKYFFQNLFVFLWSNTSFKTFSPSYGQILLSKPFHILTI